jgi:hypothetical protein
MHPPAPFGQTVYIHRSLAMFIAARRIDPHFFFAVQTTDTATHGSLAACQSCLSG